MTHYADLGNGKYRNPILFADYSDPDVIRVGENYYLTASSFNYTPGLPILASKDLVNWKLVNYALNNITEKRYDIPRHSEGVWAPAIRYHEGVFYIYYGMPDEGIYVVRTTDPLGKWEEPVCVLQGKGLIDSCPFWDEDGRAYIIHGYAKSRIGFKSILGIFEMSPDGLKAISEDHFIFDGNDPKHPAVTIEGPKVYKRDDYYYIFAPAGGVKYGYQVALRSRNICGPYEIKEVMHSGSSIINGPHQGGLVDTISGEEWFIHFQDRGLYGRICHLQPVSWKDGWPVIGVNADEKGCGEPVFEFDKPCVTLMGSTDNIQDSRTGNDSYGLEATDNFENGRYGLMWQWLGNHYDAFYSSIPGKEKGIRLNALNQSDSDNPIIWNSPNVLTQKLIYPMFRSEIRADLSGLEFGERAGICLTGGQYVAVFVERVSEDKYLLKSIKSQGEDGNKSEKVLSEFDFQKVASGFGYSLKDALKELSFGLCFDCDDDKTSEQMYFGNLDDDGLKPVLKVYLYIGKDKTEDTNTSEVQKEYDLGIRYTPSDHTWVGAKLGIFAIGSKKTTAACGYADFLSVVTSEI